jgi:hypothetical protein
MKNAKNHQNKWEAHFELGLDLTKVSIFWLGT